MRNKGGGFLSKKVLGLLITILFIGSTFSIIPHVQASLDFTIDTLTPQYTSYNVGDTPEFWAVPRNTGTNTIPDYDIRGDFTVIAPSGARIDAGNGWNGVPIPTSGSRIIINTDESWTIPPDAESGMYDLEVEIRSQSTGLTRIKTVLDSFSVQAPPPPDFDVDIEPDNQIINQGDSTTFTITVTAFNFWTDPVTLSAGLLPDDVDWSFDPETGIPTFTSTLSITTYPDTTPGNFPFTVKGEGSGKQHTAPATLIIQEVVPPFDFSINPSVSEIIVAKGGTSEPINVQVNLESGTAERVDIVLEGLEDMGAYSFSPLFGTPDFSTELTIGLFGNVPLGIYDLTIKGVGGGNTRTANIALEIVDSIALPDYEKIPLRIELEPISGDLITPGSEISVRIYDISKRPLSLLTNLNPTLDDYLFIDILIELFDKDDDDDLDLVDLIKNIEEYILEEQLKTHIQSWYTWPWVPLIDKEPYLEPIILSGFFTTLAVSWPTIQGGLYSVASTTTMVSGIVIPVPIIFIEKFCMGGISPLGGQYSILTSNLGTGNPLIFSSYCPVDLEITDQTGRTINKYTNEIPGADYVEADSDGDGELDDTISLPDLPGMEYTLYVTPEPDASPTDTFTLITGDEEIGFSLLDFIEISKISEEGYKIVNENVINIAQEWDLTINVVGSGSTDPSPGVYTYVEDTSVSVNALPDAGWMLDHWEFEETDIGSDDPITVTMDDNHTLTAVYVRTRAELYYDDGSAEFAFGAGIGSIGAVKFTYSSTAKVHKLKFFCEGETARVHVLDSEFNSIFSRDVIPTSSTYAEWFTVDISLDDVFVNGDFYVGIEWTSLTLSLGVDSSSPHHDRSYLGLLSSPGSAKSGEDYMIRVIYEDVTEPTIPERQLTIQVFGSGTTNPTPGVYEYEEDSQVIVYALPDSGWKLDHWDLGLVEVVTEEPITVTMDDDYTLTAVFVPVKLPPVADAGGPYSGSIGVAIAFDGTGSADPDGTIVSYAWTFGDGESGTGATPSHAYAVIGNYTALLTVTDNEGLTDSDTVIVAVVEVLPDMGILSINTTPFGGEVFVDEEFWGMAPQSKEVEVGSYTVSFGDVEDYTTPSDEEAVITKDTTTHIEVNYVLAPVNEIPLSMDWNLISLPLIPDDSSIEVVLSEIIDYVESVWAFDGETKTWSSYSPGAPSDLTEMVDGKGYWMSMTASAVLTVSGTEMPVDPFDPLPAYPVVEGWNLIGFKETYTMTVGDYLAGVEYVRVYEFVDAYNSLTATDYMIPGRGYWIAVSEPGTIYP